MNGTAPPRLFGGVSVRARGAQYVPKVRATCQCTFPHGHHEGICRAAAVERVNAIVGACWWTPEELNVLGDAVHEAAKRRERHSDAWRQLVQLSAELHAAARVQKGNMTIEGVRYYRFRISFRLTDGRRRVWTRWAPGAAFMAESIRRELDDRFEDSDLESGVRVMVREL